MQWNYNANQSKIKNSEKYKENYICKYGTKRDVYTYARGRVLK